MYSDRFHSLENKLLDSGVARRHVRRIVAELDDHFEDLVDELLATDCGEAEARRIALERIGDPDDIASRMLAVPAFRAWIYRYPRLARVCLPVAYALLLPATPVFAGMANPGVVMRWGAAMMLGAGVTAVLLLSMQLAIVLT